jgi:hypothetical protein
VTTNTSDFWEVTPYNFVEIYKCYKEESCLYLPEAAVTQFSTKTYHLIPNVALSNFFSNTHSASASVNITDQVPRPLKLVKQFSCKATFNTILTFWLRFHKCAILHIFRLIFCTHFSYLLCLVHPFVFDLITQICSVWREVQIYNLSITQFSRAYCYSCLQSPNNLHNLLSNTIHGTGQQSRKRMYNVKLWRVRVNTVAMESRQCLLRVLLN